MFSISGHPGRDVRETVPAGQHPEPGHGPVEVEAGSAGRGRTARRTYRGDVAMEESP